MLLEGKNYTMRRDILQSLFFTIDEEEKTIG